MILKKKKKMMQSYCIYTQESPLCAVDTSTDETLG